MIDRPATGHAHGSLPSEEELLKTLDGHYHEDMLHRTDGAHKYFKLFVTICLAAPVATFFSMLVITGFGKGDSQKAPVPSSGSVSEISMDQSGVVALLREMEKSNARIADSLEAQTRALEKMAVGIPNAVVESAKATPAAVAPDISVEGPKVIVVKTPTVEPFDLGYEKLKIFQLCGVDLDDPISGPGKFSNIESVEVVKEVIHSLDLILASSKENKDISPFILGNALKGRKFAIEQMKKIK